MILMLLVSPFFVACKNEPTAEELAAREKQAEEDRIEAIFEQVKNEVRGSLIDPDSAQFRNFMFFDRYGVVCGFVNSKNRMGGYAGTHWVVYVPGNEVQILEHFSAQSVCSNKEHSEDEQAVLEYLWGFVFPSENESG